MTKIFNAFTATVKQTPDKPAIIHGDLLVTYARLERIISSWIRLTNENNVRRKERIIVILPNCIDFAALMLCAAATGTVLVPLSPELKAEAIHAAVDSTDARHLICTPEVMERIEKSSLDFSGLNGLRFCPEYMDNQQSLSEIPDTGIAEDSDPYVLLTTSGSTGAPKPIVLSQANKWNRAMASVELYSITSNDITLAGTPMYHSLAERLVLIPLITGGTAVIMSDFSPADWLATVEREKVTFTIAVSSQLRSICKLLTEIPDPRTKSLRCIVSSSALLENSVKNELVSKLKCDLHECYGASEIAIASNLDGRAAATKLKSVGNAAPGVDIKILKESGEFAAPGEPGEIICRTPMLFQGYFKKPGLTAGSMHGEYFKTGDIGKLDDDGFLYFLGRSKEIIISGGMNIYPTDIEGVIMQHSSVRECAAFAYPDANLGEVVAVAVVPESPEEFNLRTLRHYSADFLADFQLPRKFFIVGELPRNTMGKLTRRVLVEQYSSKVN